MSAEELATYKCQRLTFDEIRVLYPNALINLTPMTKQEQFERALRNMRARKPDYKSTIGYRE